MSQNPRLYVGIDQDIQGGMTPTGTLIRDAWVFGILPETETCAGWDPQRIQVLYDRVSDAWEPHGHLVSQLPAELRERHRRIHDAAMVQARARGWDPELDDEEEG